LLGFLEVSERHGRTGSVSKRRKGINGAMNRVALGVEDDVDVGGESDVSVRDHGKPAHYKVANPRLVQRSKNGHDALLLHGYRASSG
jgi:hypothetical protein